LEKQRVGGSDFVDLMEDGTKLKIPSEITSPLKSPVNYYTSYTNVFGVGVLAHSSISTQKFQHTCAVLAAWLDNNQDGCTDNPGILPWLVHNVSLIIILEIWF
jgi:hypothetical protein